jgi:hypothetical protein
VFKNIQKVGLKISGESLSKSTTNFLTQINNLLIDESNYLLEDFE